ncbi:hypothetical protein LTR17_009109 [Elasticomyces elasticus]|nr:hypothetical protein LTR17_009109 [Elasticomyces elasticus]
MQSCKCPRTNTGSASATSYPTRLLDFGKPSARPTVRLIHTADEIVHGHYNTLSYCWGGFQSLKLLDSNLTAFQSGIAIRELPLTFQHAREVCLLMGVRYLWIDSLCIIQDQHDQSDFIRESRTMHLVYADALLNISATASTDSSAGLFRDRNVSSIPVQGVMALNGDAYELLDQSYWLRMVMSAPVNRRAWVLQERLLAKRVLHFTAHEVMWECDEFYASERYPNGIPRISVSRQAELDRSLEYSHDHRRLGILSRTESETSDYGQFYRLWWETVEMYTRVRLTFADDRPIAILGLAERFSSVFGEYRSGMWVSQKFENQFLWTSVPINHHTNQKESYSDPGLSFCWLSAGCRVVQRTAESDNCLMRVDALIAQSGLPDAPIVAADVCGVCIPITIQSVEYWWYWKFHRNGKLLGAEVHPN